MPYYCTVPRCTSMAGKAKNVSFHQFPRDEELAKLWNKILKRGKPYTKYSKVCSLHFKPDDYTITNVGKNKGQWRTLRKDAIPSQNLPSDSPIPYERRQSGNWMPNSITPNLVDPQMQQVARAIYMQTILAMQAATATDSLSVSSISIGSESPQIDNQIRETLGDAQTSSASSTNESSNEAHDNKSTSFKCNDCSRCFKDPDVFMLHRRTHTKGHRRCTEESGSEKENLSLNSALMLQANPILANMLKSNTDNVDSNVSSHLMTALALNFQNYMNSLTSIVKCDTVSRDCDNASLDESKLVIDETV